MRFFLINSTFEEAVFRLTIAGLVNKYFGFIPALLISSVIFGLAHFIFFTWRMVIISFIGGLILGTVYLKLGGLLGFWLCVLLHTIGAYLIVNKGGVR